MAAGIARRRRQRSGRDPDNVCGQLRDDDDRAAALPGARRDPDRFDCSCAFNPDMDNAIGFVYRHLTVRLDSCKFLNQFCLGESLKRRGIGMRISIQTKIKKYEKSPFCPGLSVAWVEMQQPVARAGK
ncbi:hypothetical protein [Chromobacterium sp. CV08]|uniref:hypothetical protein n=1 Tax=Chromobacterium sp. CV08 TaxID=3133274 RepID=UPI003DA8DBDC